MASWSELLKSLNDQDDPGWLDRKLKEHLDAISKQRGDAAVIFYASAFLQKAADNVSITREDINGFMNALCTDSCRASRTAQLPSSTHPPRRSRSSYYRKGRDPS